MAMNMVGKSVRDPPVAHRVRGGGDTPFLGAFDMVNPQTLWIVPDVSQKYARNQMVTNTDLPVWLTRG
jgi:hypothetical protein